MTINTRILQAHILTLIIAVVHLRHCAPLLFSCVMKIHCLHIEWSARWLTMSLILWIWILQYFTVSPLIKARTGNVLRQYTIDRKYIQLQSTNFVASSSYSSLISRVYTYEAISSICSVLNSGPIWYCCISGRTWNFCLPFSVFLAGDCLTEQKEQVLMSLCK